MHQVYLFGIFKKKIFTFKLSTDRHVMEHRVAAPKPCNYFCKFTPPLPKPANLATKIKVLHMNLFCRQTLQVQPS